jgi:hypothetical protein
MHSAHPATAAPESAELGSSGQRRILALFLLLGLPMAAQSPGAPTGMRPAQSQINPHVSDPMDSNANFGGRIEARRIAQLNLIRQRSMVSDAEKLLQLAQELNADADASGTILSPAERVHKASEIEKLAKNVKEKMTYAIGAPEEMAGPTGVWTR